VILYCSTCQKQLEGKPGDTHFVQDDGLWQGTQVPCGTLWPERMVTITETVRQRQRQREAFRWRRRRKHAKHRRLTDEEIEERYGQWRENE
jgi:hypothetical protein